MDRWNSKKNSAQFKKIWNQNVHKMTLWQHQKPTKTEFCLNNSCVPVTCRYQFHIGFVLQCNELSRFSPKNYPTTRKKSSSSSQINSAFLHVLLRGFHFAINFPHFNRMNTTSPIRLFFSSSAGMLRVWINLRRKMNYTRFFFPEKLTNGEMLFLGTFGSNYCRLHVVSRVVDKNSSWRQRQREGEGKVEKGPSVAIDDRHK